MPLTPLKGEYPYERDMASSNTRCELAEGVAFSKDLDLPMDSPIRTTVNDLIHHYLEYILGNPTKD